MVIKCNGCDGKGWVVVEDIPTRIFQESEYKESAYDYRTTYSG